MVICKYFPIGSPVKRCKEKNFILLQWHLSIMSALPDRRNKNCTVRILGKDFMLQHCPPSRITVGAMVDWRPLRKQAGERNAADLDAAAGGSGSVREPAWDRRQRDLW